MQKIYLTLYNWLIAQDLWQAQYQILLKIDLNDFVESNVYWNILIKKKQCGIKYSDCSLESTYFKDDLLEYKCLICNKNFQIKFDLKLKKLFFNTHKFSSDDNNKFVLLLRKGVYPYEYMDDSENQVKHNYLEKKTFTVT